MKVTVRVRDVMDEDVVFLEANETVMKAVQTMLEHGVWSLVITREGLPVGVVTERDIIRRCISKGHDPERLKVGDIMSSPLITIEPDAPIGEAMRLMTLKNIRRLYVVEGGKIIGRITQTGAFRYLLDVLMALSQLSHQI